jgi:hypothetical protein
VDKRPAPIPDLGKIHYQALTKLASVSKNNQTIKMARENMEREMEIKKTKNVPTISKIP